MNEVIIIAGGLGTRLGTLTNKIPKSLIDIDGNPFIYYQLKLLEEKGFDHVILALGKYGEKVEKYVRKMETTMQIDYSYDGDTLLGTGGAVAKAAELVITPWTFTIYGDSYLPIDYEKIDERFRIMQSPLRMYAMMTIYENKNPLHKNNVAYDKDSQKIEEYTKKGASYYELDYLDYGASIFYKTDLMMFSGEQFDLSMIHKMLARTNTLGGYLIDTPFYEVGSPEGLGEFKNYIKEKNNVQ